MMIACWSVGRSVEVKRQLLAHLMGSLAMLALDTEQVMVVFRETAWKNWSSGGDRLLHT